MKNSIHILYLFVFLFLLSSSNLFSQPTWQWGKTVRLTTKDIAVDNLGNSYVMWLLEDVYGYDDEVFISHGSNDIALTGFDCDGNHRWTKIIGGPGTDAGNAIGTDTLGGVYLIGSVNGARESTDSIYIDTDTTIVPPRKGMLLVKYDTDGNFQWLRMPEDTVIMTPPDFKLGGALDMDVAPNGDCYIYSKLSPGTYGDGAFEATYEGPIVGANYGENIYALKYDRNGNCTGGIHFDFYWSGAVLNHMNLTRDHYNDRFYASGVNKNVQDTIILDGTQIDGLRGYIASFNNQGNINWVKTANNAVLEDVIITSGPLGKLAFDSLGTIYSAGGSAGNGAGFGNFTFDNPYPLGQLYGFPVLFKFSPSGELLNTTSAAVNGDTPFNGVALAGNIIGGVGSGGNVIWGDLSMKKIGDGYNLFLVRFDADSLGQPLSLDTLEGSPGSIVNSSRLVSDDQGNFYVGGKFSSKLYVADEILYNQSGNSEGFIAKFGTDSCYCPLPTAIFTYDTIPNELGYNFTYTGSADVDSVVWDFGDGQTGYGFNPFHVFAQSGNYTVCATAYNTCGADSVCTTIEFIGPVGVKAINGFEEIRLYPNPAQASLNIDHALPGTCIDVIDAVGHHLHSVTLQSSPAQIDISSFTPGIYLLQLTDSSGKRGYARFVKQ